MTLQPQVAPHQREHFIRNMKVAETLCIAERPKDIVTVDAKPVVQRGPPECRGRSHHCQNGLFPPTRYQTGFLRILRCERLADIARSHDTCHQFACENEAVGWHSTEHVRIHHVDQPVAPSPNVPPDPLIASGEIENWISEGKQTDQFVIAVVPDKESHSPSVALR